MNLAETIRTRRTIHQYLDKPVAEELVLEALELALWAPNHRLTFPWRFVIAGPEARQRITQIAVELKSQKKSLSDTERAMVEKNFLNPPYLVVLGQAQNADPAVAKEDYASIACGVQNASLILWSHGVGSKWTTGGPTRHPDTYRVTGFDPTKEEIIGFFWIGFAERAPVAPKRPPLEKFLRRCP